ncbi:Rieske (2Fe-2S) protein [Candidatus Bathyarchaeota archaeon]|nr:MAG: Rieske (2Fe-2S) protein [Candidatus Bathyarchaeota archaeon]
MDDKKPSTSTNSPPPSTQPAASQPPNPAPLAKSPLISRRRFLQGALAASAVLAAASVGASGQILGPLIPPRLPSQTLIGTDTTTLESGYDGAVAAGTLYTDLLSGKVPSWTHFFYWPFDSTVSPYYKNVVCRLPDPVQLTSMSNAFTAPDGTKFVAYNVTCVHLRCLVNPGYAGPAEAGEFRLQCPCHGSQYRISDGVPVAGPAFDLGLLPLPQITLGVDSTGKQLVAIAINGEPGVGRTQ